MTAVFSDIHKERRNSFHAKASVGIFPLWSELLAAPVASRVPTDLVKSVFHCCHASRRIGILSRRFTRSDAGGSKRTPGISPLPKLKL